MLPSRLLDYERTDDGRVVPRWLVSRDAPWLTELALEARAAGGRPIGEVNEQVLAVVVPHARKHGASRRLVEAVWTVERRRWSKRIDSAVAPSELRRVLFELAAERPREEALATAAALLGIEASRIEASLFADRARARILVPPRELPGPDALGESYNLAMIQALLARATEVVAVVRSNLRRVCGYAKLLGLMASFAETEDGATRMTLSGPLALFHDTTKYGNALARWFPSLVTTRGWSLSARLLLRDEALRLELDATSPVPRTHALPRMHDSRIEAWLDADLRRSGSAWRVEREPAVIRSPDHEARLFFPDFALVSERGKVLVEVVGWWTSEYVADKISMLHAARVPLVLSVDARRAAGRELIADPRVVPFEKRIDAAALVAACDRVLDASSKDGSLVHVNP